MKEKDINRMVFSNFRREGNFGHKISDDAQSFTSTSKKPFDGWSVTSENVYFLEGKLLKNSYGSFNFSKLESHQYDSLNLISSLTKTQPNVKSLVYIVWWQSRVIYDLLFIDIRLIQYLQNLGKKSILKKEALKIKENDLMFSIKKGTFPILKINEKTLNIQKWEKIFNERLCKKI